MKKLLILLCAHLLYAVHAAPQFITFKDGKIGVNFGGYHAEAGLGGLLTGNAAHGGLSASAGTPWGQNAAAGLGGSTDGRSTGIAYAGAQAIPSVGASAVLGGTAGEHGFAGSEAHANGKVRSNAITIGNDEPQENPLVISGPTPLAPTDAIQKIKPPKKYSLFKPEDTQSSSAPTIPMTTQQNLRIPDNNSKRVDDAISTNSPTAMINIHRQRVRERRRQQQQQKDIDEFQTKRAHQERLRARHRSYQRQRNVVRTRQTQGIPRHLDSPTTALTSDPLLSAAEPKDYLQNTPTEVVHSKRLSKSVSVSALDTPVPQQPYSPDVNYNANPGMLGNVLNIPIGILQTIQESLTGVQVGKSG